VLGYTTQARFLLNCGLVRLMEHRQRGRARDALKLLMEHEMGELFKVLGCCRGRRRGNRWALLRATAATRPMMAPRMIRWLIVIFLALVLISWFTPLLRKLALGKPARGLPLPAVWPRVVHSAGVHRGAELGGRVDFAAGLTAARHAGLHRHRRHQGGGQPGG
jgi:hypothetical protein